VNSLFHHVSSDAESCLEFFEAAVRLPLDPKCPSPWCWRERSAGVNVAVNQFANEM